MLGQGEQAAVDDRIVAVVRTCGAYRRGVMPEGAAATRSPLPLSPSMDVVPDASLRPPVVIAVAPRRGWAAADRPRRLAAVLAVPLAVALCLVSTGQGEASSSVSVWALLVWMVVGPASFYSLARVLRPEPYDLERTSRHLLASAATSFGLPTAVGLALGLGNDLVIGLGVPAFGLGLLTVLWGVIAVAVRALTAPAAARALATATRPS